MPRRSWLALPIVLGALAALAVWVSARPPEGPVEPRWDHERCARCGMLISDPRFAAQVQRTDGTVLHYDDPGCLLVHDERRRGALSDAHAVWFHHGTEPRWIPLDRVGFVPAGPTPMDFGLMAVERASREDAIGPVEARTRLLASAEAKP